MRWNDEKLSSNLNLQKHLNLCGFSDIITLVNKKFFIKEGD